MVKGQGATVEMARAAKQSSLWAVRERF